LIDFDKKKIQSFNIYLRSFILNFDLDKTARNLVVIDNSNLLLLIDLIEVKIKKKIILQGHSFCLKWSPMGKYLALNINKYIQIWKFSSNINISQSVFYLIRTHSTHYSDIRDIEWNFNGEYILSGGSDYIIKIFSFRKKNGFLEINLVKLKERIIALKFFSFNKFLVLCKNNILYQWKIDIKKTKLKEIIIKFYARLNFKIKFFFKDSLITSFFINFLSEILFLGKSNGNLALFILIEPKKEKKISKKIYKNKIKKLGKICFFNSFLFSINFFSVCKNNNYIAIGNLKKRKILVFDREKAKIIINVESNLNLFSSISISPNNKLIITGKINGEINIWSFKKGFCLMKFHNHTLIINRVSFFKNSSRLSISSSSDGTLKIYDLKKCLVIKALNYYSKVKEFEVLDINESNFLVASACKITFIICIWSLKSGRLIETLNGHISSVTNLFFIRNNLKIISGSLDKTFRIWDFKKKSDLSYSCCCEIYKTNQKILKMSFDPNSNEIAFLINNDCILLFNVRQTKISCKIQKGIKTFFKIKERINKIKTIYFLKYSFDGEKIFFGNLGNKIFFFFRNLPKFLKSFCFSYPFIKENKIQSGKTKKNLIIDLVSSYTKDSFIILFSSTFHYYEILNEYEKRKIKSSIIVSYENFHYFRKTINFIFLSNQKNNGFWKFIIFLKNLISIFGKNLENKKKIKLIKQIKNFFLIEKKNISKKKIFFQLYFLKRFFSCKNYRYYKIIKHMLQKKFRLLQKVKILQELLIFCINIGPF
jgi:periodic tryptophan protein 2